MFEGLKKLNITSLSWREREADAAYMRGDKGKATQLYEEIVNLQPKRRVVWRKLLDVAHQLSNRSFEFQIRRRFSKVN